MDRMGVYTAILYLSKPTLGLSKIEKLLDGRFPPFSLPKKKQK